ncbi:MAG: hypothetical protein ACREQJ_08935 [Candidatus Binatia bacterium]
MRDSLKILVSAVVGGLTAYLVALTLGTAYREGELLEALIPLVLVPAAMFVLYEGTKKRTISCLAGLLLTAGILEATNELGFAWSGVIIVLSSAAAVALPLAVDLVSIDLGKRIRLDRPVATVMATVFAIALLPLSGWRLVTAHQRIVEEDGKLVDELASRIWPWKDSLIVYGLDPKLSARAQKRVSIRADGKTYQLADAELESVVEEKIVRTRTRRRGPEKIDKQQEERMRLILKLQGTGIPDDVVVYSRRGPLTISEAKVPPLEPSVSQ